MTAQYLDSGVAEWLVWPETRKVMQALDAIEHDQARFVGGAVRDAVLGISADDVDIACRMPPGQVMDRLKSAGIKAIPTGIDHGTVTAICGKRTFEVTTLRRDVDTFGRHARVAYTDNWAEDAARRDFTFNALYADFRGGIYDPFGGIDDLQAGRVRFIGEADERLAEDALRILRFFRFHAWYGKGELDETGLAACARSASAIDILSAERITKEWLKLLGAPATAATVRVMADMGIIAYICGAPVDIERLESLEKIETLCGGPDAIRRLAALVWQESPGGAPHLRLSNRQTKRLMQLIETHSEISPDMTSHDVKLGLYRWGRERFCDHVMLEWARCASAETDHWMRLLQDVRAATVPVFPLTGADVLATGVSAGPDVGHILSQVESHWIAAGFPADRKLCLAFLSENIQTDD